MLAVSPLIPFFFFFFTVRPSARAIQINKRALHHGRSNCTPSLRLRPPRSDAAEFRPTLKSRARCAVPPPLNGEISDDNDNHVGKDSRLPLFPPWARTLIVFGLGYGIGCVSAPGWQRQSRVASRIGFTKIALAVLIWRDVWRSTPKWAKPRMSTYGKRFINLLRSLPRRLKGEREKAMDGGEDGAEDLDDITKISNFATKVQDVIIAAKSKLDLEDHNHSAEVTKKAGTDQVRNDFNVQSSLLALIQLFQQVKSRHAGRRDRLYRSSGPAVPDELLEGMDEMFEFADLAYDESEDGDIGRALQGMGYSLIKHDTTSVPGHLGHYVAINSDPLGEKTAVIGVKGTSDLADLLTDMCASAVEYDLGGPFYEGGVSTLRCHEGVFISSRRLAEELLPLVNNLLLPSGYKMIVVGHSLGAGCAAVLSAILRAGIPSLQSGGRLKAWAFASPPVLDLTSALGCSSFVTAVVNGCDVVPRANVGPLAVTFGLLRAVNGRLRERDLDASDLRSTLAFLNKMKEGRRGEMLMSADEVASELDRALERVELRDPDHLYVPGKVVLMYDLWEKERKKESGREFTDVLKDWLQKAESADVHSNTGGSMNVPMAEEAVLCDGTCTALRVVDLDSRLLDDHMAPQYRSSIANILCSRKRKRSA